MSPPTSCATALTSHVTVLKVGKWLRSNEVISVEPLICQNWSSPKRKRRQRSPSPICEDIARRWLSASYEEDSHCILTLDFLSLPPWEIKLLCVSPQSMVFRFVGPWWLRHYKVHIGSNTSNSVILWGKSQCRPWLLGEAPSAFIK